MVNLIKCPPPDKK